MPVLAVRPKSARAPSDWSDRVILRRLLIGDDVAWSELIRRYRSLVYRCIAKIVCKCAPSLCGADIDEIYSEVLMSLIRDDYRKLRAFNPRRGTKLGSWLGLIAVNASYDYLRRSLRRPMLDRIDGLINPHEECDRTPLDVMIEKERWNHLNRLLDDFSERDRAFLELYYCNGLDAPAVADRMNISLKTVYSKKHKIRIHLRRCVADARPGAVLTDLVPAAA